MFGFPLAIFLLISIPAFSQTEQTLPDSTNDVRNDSAYLLSDSTFAADSLAVQKIISDSLKVLKHKADSLVIFSGRPFFDESLILSHSELIHYDYRYTGDFFDLAGMAFKKDLGFIGQNNETIIYGAGFNGISYFQDGVLVNNRSLNSFDLNNVPSELIDSVEILPSVRGFLYGPVNNPVSINLITKDITPKAAFSRIKYFEGAFGEAMIDGIFSASVFRKLFLYFEVSNRKVDRRYLNSSYSSWLGKIKLKYIFNEFLNFQADYGYVKSNKGLNGGADVDSIQTITSNVDSLLYSEVLSPVKFRERSYDVKQHHFGFRVLSEIKKWSGTDLNLYYRFSLEELNNTGDADLLAQDLRDKTYGASLRQNFSSGVFNAEINGVYEYSDFLNRRFFLIDTLPISSSGFISDYKNFALSSIFSVHTANKRLKFSAFYKYTGRNKNNFYNGYRLGGWGFDLVFNLTDKIKLYSGYSSFEPHHTAKNISAIEGAINYSGSDFSSGIRIFIRQSEIVSDPILFRAANSIINPFQDMLGVELSAKTKLWKILFEGSGTIYSPAGDETELYNIPAQHFSAGIYFTDILFDSNLDLKAGFIYYFTGKQNLFNYSVPNSSQLDFTLTGEIQKSAIAYFTWENLLGAEYFIVPYYPMPLRGIRFGVSWEFLN